MFVTLIVVLLILAAFSLVWWGVNAMALPAQVKVPVLVILGLVALWIIYQFVVGGGHMPSMR
jgi:hypothetical protein